MWLKNEHSEVKCDIWDSMLKIFAVRVVIESQHCVSERNSCGWMFCGKANSDVVEDWHSRLTNVYWGIMNLKSAKRNLHIKEVSVRAKPKWKKWCRSYKNIFFKQWPRFFRFEPPEFLLANVHWHCEPSLILRSLFLTRFELLFSLPMQF